MTAAEGQKATAEVTINHQEQSAAGWKMDLPRTTVSCSLALASLGTRAFAVTATAQARLPSDAKTRQLGPSEEAVLPFPASSSQWGMWAVPKRETRV